MSDIEEKLSKDDGEQLQAGREYVAARKQQQTHFRDLQMMLRRLRNTNEDATDVVNEHLGINE